MPERRFPASVYRVGDEPDARFTLANERTFLAWSRTALAMIAGGVALEALALEVQPQLRVAASLLLVIAGIMLAPVAYLEWMRTERALRRAAALPGSRMSVGVAVVVAVVGVLLALGTVWR